MRRCLLILWILSLCIGLVCAQAKPKVKPATPKAEAETASDLSNQEAGLIGAISEAEAKLDAKYQLDRIRKELAELSVEYTQDFPDVRRLTEERNKLIKFLAPQGEKADWAAALSNLYLQAVKFPRVMAVILSKITSTYTSGVASANSALQVSQVAGETSIKLQILLAAQNQRIIELLEILAKRK